MSHYNSIKTKITDQAAVLAALATLGLTPRVHENPVPLVGFLQDAREQVAHIVVPGRTAEFGLNSSSNDLGIYRENDGTFTLIVSDYDRGWLSRKHGGQTRSFDTVFKQTYALEIVKREMPNMTLGNITFAEDGTMTSAFTVAVPDQLVSVGI